MPGESTPVIPIPDINCQNVGVEATWGLGNQLFVYAGLGHKDDDGQTRKYEAPAAVHEVRWDTDMHTPVARKLVNEAHQIFVNLQLSSGKGGKSEIAVRSSRDYRAVIKACVMDLRGAVVNSHNSSEQESLEGQLKIFDMVELIWSLCEILFIETLPGGVVLQQLVDWTRLHFNEGAQMASEVMEAESPHTHKLYWQAVYSFALQGQLDKTRRLLSVHPAKQSPHFQLMDHLMKTMPSFSTGSQALGEFEMKFHHWQEQCHRHLEDGAFAIDEQLEVICKILIGQDEVFLELKELIGSWYCMLICRLLYQKPAVKVLDLQYSAQFCINAYGGYSQMQAWDDILLAAIQFDIHQVIKESSASLSNWWFVSHLTDLLHHCGKLESQTLSFGSNLREFLLLEYASSLMSHHSLWQVGASYFDHCPEFGRFYLERFIDHLPIESDRKAQKVINLCESRGLQDQVRSICKTMGMKAMYNGRLGSALSWGLKSNDVNFATFLAEKFLSEYSESGLFLNLDLIDNLGSSMLLSSKLTFLGKYREFHKLYEDGDFKSAASLLLSLLTSRVAPKKFWLTLLLDALPLLEAEEVIFDTQNTYELMHCLKQLQLERKLLAKENPASVNKNPAQSEKLDLMKLALGRNLARAMILEQSR